MQRYCVKDNKRRLTKSNILKFTIKNNTV